MFFNEEGQLYDDGDQEQSESEEEEEGQFLA